MNEAGVNYGVEKIPSFGKQDSISILTTSAMSLSKDSKHKEAAWEFIKYYCEEEYANAYKLLESPGQEAFVEMLEQSSGYTPANFKIDEWSEVSEDLSLAFEEIFNPSSLRNVSDVLEEAAGK